MIIEGVDFNATVKLIDIVGTLSTSTEYGYLKRREMNVDHLQVINFIMAGVVRL